MVIVPVACEPPTRPDGSPPVARMPLRLCSVVRGHFRDARDCEMKAPLYISRKDFTTTRRDLKRLGFDATCLPMACQLFASPTCRFRDMFAREPPVLTPQRRRGSARQGQL